MSDQHKSTRSARSPVEADGSKAGDAGESCRERTAFMALTGDERREKNRTHWQTRTLRRLHDNVVGLKSCAWNYATAHAQMYFVGGQPREVFALREKLRRMAELVGKSGARLQDGTTRHIVTTFALHARAICEQDVLPAIIAMVRVHELYMAAEPKLSFAVEEWIRLGPVEGLPGIDPETDAGCLARDLVA